MNHVDFFFFFFSLTGIHSGNTHAKALSSELLPCRSYRDQHCRRARFWLRFCPPREQREGCKRRSYRIRVSPGSPVMWRERLQTTDELIFSQIPGKTVEPPNCSSPAILSQTVIFDAAGGKNDARVAPLSYLCAHVCDTK